MIEVIYDGNLGNNLFQYCFGRILAETLKYKLVAKPIPGFSSTSEPVEGHIYDKKEVITLRGQKPDLSFMNQKDPQYHVLVTGYFQRYEYYEEHTRSIKKWLAIEDNLTDCDITAGDVVLGIRRGKDYIPRHGLPLSYYETALASLNYDRVFICTNEPTDPFIKYFEKKYGAIVRPPGARDNLLFIKKFKKIIISNSTFLWWAAFLSEAEEIIFPRPQNGFWSDTDQLSKNISLEVNEARYRYLECDRYESEFILERMTKLRDDFVSYTKSRMKSLLPNYKSKIPQEKSSFVFSEKFDE